MSRRREIRVCRCGAAFRVSTYRPGDNRPIWHCECPPCERASQRVCAAIAVALADTPIGLVCARVAQGGPL